MTTSTPLPPHPGEVRMLDMFTHELKVLPVQAIPEERRFVYLKDGIEVSAAAGADRAVPIVEVRMFPVDAEGRLVEKSKAVRIRITEHGPDGQSLRSTLMMPK